MRNVISYALAFGGVVGLVAACATAETPFATTVVDYSPAPGQFVTSIYFNDPSKAIGRPYGDGFSEPGNSSLVTLGGFGGSIVLAFDETVRDDEANPFGLDAIVYGNAFWVDSDPRRKWAECGIIEISRDANSNGLADDAWYLIPGSHLEATQPLVESQIWDDDIGDPTYPPLNPIWLPSGQSGTWTTESYRLPSDVFDTMTLDNPGGLQAETEAVFGYADLSPTLTLGDMDGDNLVDDPQTLPEEFYTRPDNPFAVGVTPGSGGGDGFDIAWAVDPMTGDAAGLSGFDFIRITTGVNFVDSLLGEMSTEIDAVADVAEGGMGDVEGDGDIDLDDYSIFAGCLGGPEVDVPTSPCRPLDYDQDGDVDLADYAGMQVRFTGSSGS